MMVQVRRAAHAGSHNSGTRVDNMIVEVDGQHGKVGALAGPIEGLQQAGASSGMLKTMARSMGSSSVSRSNSSVASRR